MSAHMSFKAEYHVYLLRLASITVFHDDESSFKSVFYHIWFCDVIEVTDGFVFNFILFFI